MFHHYVNTSAGRKIDFDRARLLMDRALLERARARIEDAQAEIQDDLREAATHAYGEVPNKPVMDEHVWLGMVWSAYCRLHHEHYGLPFEPDVSSRWDA